LKAKGCWPWADDVDRSGYLVLIDGQQRIRPIALSIGEGTTAFEYHVVKADSDEIARQPERHQKLAEKRVALIGLGSVGSKVALTLARSGVHRFLLVDDDVLLPANLSRHQLDWLSIGMDKVDGVSAAISLIRPDSDVETQTFRFAGQESSSYNTTVLQRVAACDLVIDATANPRAFAAISAICTHKKVSLVWGELFAGGIGALMARSLPGKDASPLEVRSAIHAYLATLPEAPFKRAQDYDFDDSGEVHIAGDAEVSYLAASLSQFAIDAMVGGNESRFPVAAYLFGYQKAWCFEAPFDTRQIECPKAEIGPATPSNAEESASAYEKLAATFFAPKC
jgi:molybdopterin/thiamine biosynthesis adenylyltransferase